MTFRYLDQILNICRGAEAPAHLYFTSMRREKSGKLSYPSDYPEAVSEMERVIDYRILELRRASRQGREVVCGISLFGDRMFQPVKSTKKPYPERTLENARYLFDVYADIDNTEYKEKRADLENDEARKAFLEETQKALYTRIVERLDAAKLLPYAALVNSGSGYHLHFILSDLYDLEKPVQILDGETDAREVYTHMAQSLVSLFGADPSKCRVSDTGKWLPGTYYHKENWPIEITVAKDAEKFLSFEELRELVATAKATLPDAPVKPKYELKEDISHLPSYMETLTKPGEYDGKREWKNQDGSSVFINKDWTMWLKFRTSDRDDNGDFKFKYIPIQEGIAILPKYRVQRSKDDKYYIAEILEPGGKSRLITLHNKAFRSSDSLQQVLTDYEIPMDVSKKVRAGLLSYFISHCKTIQHVDVEASPEHYASFDFLYRNGIVYKSQDGIVKTEGGDYQLRGFEDPQNMRLNPDFVKSGPVDKERVFPALKIFEEKMNRAFKDKRMNSLYLSFLGASLLRDRFLRIFEDFPILGLFGEGSTGKTTMMRFVSKIFNTKLINDPTVHQLGLKAEGFKNHIMLMNEINDHERKFLQFFKDASSNGERTRQGADGTNKTTHIRNSILFSTNEVFSEDALNSRIVHLQLSTDNLSDLERYDDLKSFVDKNSFEILMSLLERVNAIDFDALLESILGIRKAMSKFVAKHRTAELYAMLIAVGAAMGLDIDVSAVMAYAEERVKSSSGRQDELAAAIYEFIVEDRKKDFVTMPEILSSDADYFIPLSELAGWLKFRNFDQFVTSRSLGKEIRSGSFARIEIHNMYHHDKLVNGTWVHVNLLNTAFQAMISGTDSSGNVLLYRLKPGERPRSIPEPAY